MSKEKAETAAGDEPKRRAHEENARKRAAAKKKPARTPKPRTPRTQPAPAAPRLPPAPLVGIMIARVMAKMVPIAKKNVHEEGHFTFRRIDEVAEVLQPLLVEAGLFIIPLETVIVSETQLSNRVGNVLFNTRVKVTWRIYASDGSFIPAETLGEGMSDMQFSTGAAQTMAYKQLLWETWMIPVRGMDPEEGGETAMTAPTAPSSIASPEATTEPARPAEPTLFDNVDVDGTPAVETTAEQPAAETKVATSKAKKETPKGEAMSPGMIGIVRTLLTQAGVKETDLLKQFKVKKIESLLKSQMKAVEDWIGSQPS